MGALSFTVDFDSRVIFTCMFMPVNFTRVNKIKTGLEREVERGSTLTCTRPVPCIVSLLFENVNFTQVRT